MIFLSYWGVRIRVRKGKRAVRPFSTLTKGGVDMATPYRKKHCDAVIAHFSLMRKNEKGVIVGAPSFVSFAESLGVTPSVIERWRREYPEFDKACCDATELVRQLLIDAALSGSVNVSAARFILSSEFGMSPGRGGKKGEAEEGEGLSADDRRLLCHLAERLGCADEND